MIISVEASFQEEGGWEEERHRVDTDACNEAEHSRNVIDGYCRNNRDEVDSDSDREVLRLRQVSICDAIKSFEP